MASPGAGLRTFTLALLVGAAGQLAAQGPKDLPLKYSGPATVPAITAGDLMTRLYKYADDSMGGRFVGSKYNLMATAYIESEVRRLGLKPAGENGSYFQNIGVIQRALDTATSTITIDGATYHAGRDFVAAEDGQVHQVSATGTVVWGTVLDTIGNPTPEEYKGKFVVVAPLMALPAGFDQGKFIASDGYKRYVAMLDGTVGQLQIDPDTLLTNQVRMAAAPPPASISQTLDRPGALRIVISHKLANAIFGEGAAIKPGISGKGITTDLRFTDTPREGRNVIAILPGTDPKLRGEYVAIGAHNDHIPMQRVVDHDSLKIFNEYARPQGADGGPTKKLSDDEWKAVNSQIDSLHKLHGGPRPDSISNGADDDGSGTVTVLELAEAFAKGNIKPKRSILFIWHAGEERGMWGSGWFTDHPTVPRDSIVAEINIDMVGRGAPSDITGVTKEGELVHGADRYVQLVGSRRLSTELGDLAETVNKNPKYNFKFDYSLDANGHPENIYCRSDHAKYAAWGIPVVFFTTGGHADYHQVTDEPQYIRYDHMALLDNYIFDLANHVADLDHRVKVDGQKMADPHGQCKQ
ncbi:MAG TPA: M20/M25/M40 family metallo-hydrolase [Gemmatimonadales bacterium]|jgi:hypothetical protein